MEPLVQEQLPAIAGLCRRLGVEQLYLFGSATGSTRRPFDRDSDLDFLVRFDASTPSGRGFERPFWQLLIGLEDLFSRRIDLVEEADLHHPLVRDRVLKEKVVLYDARSHQVAARHPASRVEDSAANV